MEVLGVPTAPPQCHPLSAPRVVAGYLRMAVEPGRVQPRVVGTFGVGGHQCQVPALLPGSGDVAQVHA